MAAFYRVTNILYFALAMYISQNSPIKTFCYILEDTQSNIVKLLIIIIIIIIIMTLFKLEKKDRSANLQEIAGINR
jgi:hypothetical protein